MRLRYLDMISLGKYIRSTSGYSTCSYIFLCEFRDITKSNLIMGMRQFPMVDYNE